MARKPKTNGIGHNSAEPLSDDDAAAMHAYFETKVRAQRRKVEAAKIEAKAQTDALNALFTTVRAEMRQARKDFEDVLAHADMTEAQFRASEAARTRRYALAGLPVGEQLDMFKHAADVVDDAIDAEANGFRAGCRGDDPIPPREVAPILHLNWMAGYHRGVERNGELFKKAETIIAERGKPSQAPAVDLGADAADKPDLDPSTIDAKAKALRKSGFTTKTPALESAH